jgi:UTP--glucose-1-phosphate uridylyltransferase
MINVTKAVIPAAGLGTRMLPAAKAVPKELLPVLDRPAIQWVVEEAVCGGISDVLLITSKQKPSLLEHFRRNEELERRLASVGKEPLMFGLNELIAKVRISAVDQPAQLGLGHAVAQARGHVANEPFVCMLGDAVFSGDVPPARQMIDAYRALGTAIIGLEQVPAEKVERYGIVGGTMISDGVMKLDRIVEKPRAAEAPTRFAVAARYLLTPTIFECLDRTTPGNGGEIQLTDAIQLMLAREPVHGVVLKSGRHDIGSPVDWLKTNLEFARRDEKLWSQISPLVRELLK